jgi:mannose-6-phosphate isomerase-like protein (cupin superfamily)
MKFSHNDVITKKFTDFLKVEEYRKSGEAYEYPMDGAIAYLDGEFGPKKNTTFTELFFVLEGEVVVKIDGKNDEVLKKEDMFIMDRDVVHTLIGKKAKMFIVCNPPFEPEGCVMVE